MTARRPFAFAQAVHGLAFSSGGQRLAAVGPGMGVIFDTATGEVATTIPDCRGHAYDVDFATDDQSVVICFHAGHVWRFDASNGRTVQKYVGHKGVPHVARPAYWCRTRWVASCISNCTDRIAATHHSW